MGAVVARLSPDYLSGILFFPHLSLGVITGLMGTSPSGLRPPRHSSSSFWRELETPDSRARGSDCFVSILLLAAAGLRVEGS
jgi:hypothetical protein